MDQNPWSDKAYLKELQTSYNHLIDAKTVFLLTHGLYKTEDAGPRYDEFRDLLSRGQILSKFWLIDQLEKLKIIKNPKSFLIAGGWFGSLGLILTNHFKNANVLSLDINPKCTDFIDTWADFDIPVQGITQNMLTFDYKSKDYDIVVNTSCEHLTNLTQWLEQLPRGQIVILQSNNYFNHSDHVNCFKTLDNFTNASKLSVVEFAGELRFPMYTRFMIIGQV